MLYSTEVLNGYLLLCCFDMVKCTWYVDMYQPLCCEQTVLKLEGFADVYIALCDVYYLGNLLGT